MAIKDTIIKGRSDSITRPSQRIDSCQKPNIRAARTKQKCRRNNRREKKTNIKPVIMCKIVIFMVAALALISGQALAQDATPKPLYCSQITSSLDWNNTAVSDIL